MNDQLTITLEWDAAGGDLTCVCANTGDKDLALRPPILQLDLRAAGSGLECFRPRPAIHAFAFGGETVMLGKGECRQFAFNLVEAVIWPQHGRFAVWMDYQALAKGIHWERADRRPSDVTARSNDVQVVIDDRYSVG